MMKKLKWIGILLIVALYVLNQWMVWQVQKFDYVNNYMFEFTTPKMRTLLAAGHDAFLADLSMIRGIQFYGMNYPLFDKHPLQYEQFKNLGESISGIDKRHYQAHQFWGFALTAAERGKVDAYHHLMNGARNLAVTDEYFHAIIPEIWRVAKEAGYIAQYELWNATPEWTVSAYQLAERSPECPDHIKRLRILAQESLLPDPIPRLMELKMAAEGTNNQALRTLNLDHIRRIIASEHKVFWDYAQAAYIRINGASPTRIAELTGNIAVLKEATQKYRERSLTWFTDGRTQLYPNLMNPRPKPDEKIEIRPAIEPELPIDPYGGEYIILKVNNKYHLLSTGPTIQERESYLEESHNALETYVTKSGRDCPDDLTAFAELTGFNLIKADSLGYPLLMDRENCLFYFPPISEENPPTLPPFGEEVKEDTEGTE